MSNTENLHDENEKEIRSLIDEILDKVSEENPSGFTSFVVEDINDRIRLSLMKLKESSSVDEISSASLSSSIVDVPSARSMSPSSTINESDKKILDEIEFYSKSLAQDFVRTVEQLTSSLHQMSANSVCCMQTYRDTIGGKLNESVESNIRAMHLFMVQAEQLSKQMAPIYELQKKIIFIKNLLDILSQSI